MTKSENDWPSACLKEAREAHNVPDTIASLLQEKLSGLASERSLRPPELADLAKELIEALQEPSAAEPGA